MPNFASNLSNSDKIALLILILFLLAAPTTGLETLLGGIFDVVTEGV